MKTFRIPVLLIGLIATFVIVSCKKTDLSTTEDAETTSARAAILVSAQPRIKLLTVQQPVLILQAHILKAQVQAHKHGVTLLTRSIGKLYLIQHTIRQLRL